MKARDVEAVALRCCRGAYQRMLIYGVRDWSGEDLAGRSVLYQKRREVSRQNLRTRLEKAGILHYYDSGSRGE